MNGLYDLMDMACADRLGVSVDEYITFVDCDLTERRAMLIIGVLLDAESTEKQIEKCKKIYQITVRKNG